jgi:hypothetical protein
VAVYRRTSRPRFTLLLLVLTAVTLLTLDERSNGLGFVDVARDGARDAFAPVKDAADAAFEPVADFFQGALHYGDVQDENARLRERLADRKIAVVLTDAAKTHLVRSGYDPNYGARPLKRTIQREVETALSRMMLRGEVRDGMTVEVDYDDARDALSFKPVVEAEVVG